MKKGLPFRQAFFYVLRFARETEAYLTYFRHSFSAAWAISNS